MSLLRFIVFNGFYLDKADSIETLEQIEFVQSFTLRVVLEFAITKHYRYGRLGLYFNESTSCLFVANIYTQVLKISKQVSSINDSNCQ